MISFTLFILLACFLVVFLNLSRFALLGDAGGVGPREPPPVSAPVCIYHSVYAYINITYFFLFWL